MRMGTNFPSPVHGKQRDLREAPVVLEHRSSIVPSPLAGKVRIGGAEAGTDSESHAWPHPHPCPLPSRGREMARTGPAVDGYVRLYP